MPIPAALLHILSTPLSLLYLNRQPVQGYFTGTIRYHSSRWHLPILRPGVHVHPDEILITFGFEGCRRSGRDMLASAAAGVIFALNVELKFLRSTMSQNLSSEAVPALLTNTIPSDISLAIT